MKASLPLLLLLLLSLVTFSRSSFSAPDAAPTPTTIVLLLTDLPDFRSGSPQSIFTYPLTLYPNTSLTLTLNVTDPVATVLYTCSEYDFESTTFDQLTALPTPATPNTVLVAHESHDFHQYNRITLPSPFTSSPAATIHLGDSQPNPTDYFDGVGDWPLWVRFLFHVDVMNAYYGASFVNVIAEGKTITFHLYIWRSPELVTTNNQPILQWQTTLPYDSNAFGLVGGVATVDQQRGLVYLPLAFWQSSNPKFNCGWLLTYHAQDNYVQHNVTYPKNVTGFYDWSVSLVWSARRQQLFSAIFEESIHLEQVDPATGASRQLALFVNPPVHVDIYKTTNILDDATGDWFFCNDDEYSPPPPAGLPTILWSFNIDTGRLGPVHHLVLPYTALAVLLPPQKMGVERRVEGERVEGKEWEQLAVMRRGKRRASSVFIPSTAKAAVDAE